MELKRYLMAATFLTAGAANAATVFAPTDGNVNFLNTNIDFSGGTTLVAMFNVGDLGGTDSAVVLNNAYTTSVADFTPVGSDFAVDVKPSATSSTVLDSMTLLGSDNFILGLSSDSGATWASDTGFTALGADSYNVHFADGSILEVDVRVVPVPAAVWLFGSGLLGLAGVARRKKAA